MKFHQSRWAVLLAGLLTLFVTACGDSNDFEEVSGQQGNPGNVNQVYAGNYLGASNLANGQTAVLSLAVSNSGQATGTLTVADPALQTQAVNLTPGAYPVSGTVNMTTGTFNLSGNLPGVGNFSISGQLPLGNAQGAYTVVINGQTYNGVIQNASQGTPTPPNNGGGDGEQRLIFGGDLTNFVFETSNDYNGPDLLTGFDPLVTGAVVTGSDTNNIVTIALSEPAEGVLFTFGIVGQNGEELVEGQTYDLVTSSTETGAIVSLSESVGTTVTSGWTLGEFTSGSVTIVDVTETGIVVDFNFDNLVPNSEIPNNAAVGSFDTSGRVSATFAPSVP